MLLTKADEVRGNARHIKVTKDMIEGDRRRNVKATLSQSLLRVADS